MKPMRNLLFINTIQAIYCQRVRKTMDEIIETLQQIKSDGGNEEKTYPGDTAKA